MGFQVARSVTYCFCSKTEVTRVRILTVLWGKIAGQQLRWIHWDKVAPLIRRPQLPSPKLKPNRHRSPLYHRLQSSVQARDECLRMNRHRAGGVFLHICSPPISLVGHSGGRGKGPRETSTGILVRRA